MYSRKNLNWLYRYYSGDRLEDIAKSLCLSTGAIQTRILSMKLPARPRGGFVGKNKEKWLTQPHVKALRRLFKGS